MNEEMITMLRDIKRSINVLLKNVWSVSDLASVLDLSESRIRHMAADGLFPYYKQKGCLYFRREEIEAWLTTHRLKLRKTFLRCQVFFVEEVANSVWC